MTVDCEKNLKFIKIWSKKVQNKGARLGEVS